MRIVEVTTQAIFVEELAARLEAPEFGAILTFRGVVRNHAAGRAVESIDYSCYEAMATKELGAVVDRVCEGHGVTHAGVIHRIGRLAVGETSLGVAVASVHRRQAFDCGLAIIDELKKTVPIWKKEFGPDGSSWV